MMAVLHAGAPGTVIIFGGGNILTLTLWLSLSGRVADTDSVGRRVFIQNVATVLIVREKVGGWTHVNLGKWLYLKFVP